MNQSYDSGNNSNELNFDDLDRTDEYIDANFGGGESNSHLSEQIRTLQKQLQEKTLQNKELRQKLEMYQEKYNKAFQDKAEMHELYLQEKQNVLDVKQELSKVKTEQQN